MIQLSSQLVLLVAIDFNIINFIFDDDDDDETGDFDFIKLYIRLLSVNIFIMQYII